MNKKWVLKRESNPEALKILEETLNINPILCQLLINRGINTYEKAKIFFRPELNQLHSPYLMKDMDVAVTSVMNHLENQNRIMVYGDYDVDGTTSVTLLFDFLSQFTSQIEYYIPDRYAEGYGVSDLGIETAKKNNCKLIISLDCGIKAIDKVQKAKDYGIDFIICDHHRPGSVLPNATAVLDPKRLDCSYPYKELSGCGVGFKLVQAIALAKDIPFTALHQYLDLLAISIGADIVSMTGENRVLSHFGLQVLNQNPRPGLKAFLPEIPPEKHHELTITDVVFKIAPRINAAGRISHAHKAVELLLEKDATSAKRFAKEIDEFNKERKDLDLNITKEALDMLENEDSTWTTVVFNKDWHKGVIGIVASRLIENFYRPTIVFTEKDGKLTGSARSIPNFDMYEALNACSEHLLQFGGHYFAAGMTLKKEKLNDFKLAFENYASKILQEEDLVEKIQIEHELEVSQITPEFYSIVKQLEPHGPDNLHPIFGAKQVVSSTWSRTLGAENEHLSLSVYEKNYPRKNVRAIAFKMGHMFPQVSIAPRFALAYTISENIWKDKRNLQLMVKDIKV
ncbi:MAG: single-stranded-DNA-specific exonuclease RecJ [Flavobacteriales bacterium]